jgi:Lon protease-like protein
MSDDLTSLSDFGGAARLFPLPNLVLFPHVVQPLHIFEPRYRQLMADALAGDRLIAMALLRPGWEEDYHQQPPIHPVVCLGRIHKEEELPDGRYNLLLHGVSRARVREEVPSPKLYRVARVELLPEVVAVSEDIDQGLRHRLAAVIGVCFAGQPTAQLQMRQLLQSQLALGTLCDVLAFALPLATEFKQELLEETDSEVRTRRLLAQLEASAQPQPGPAGAGRKWPPEFSVN